MLNDLLWCFGLCTLRAVEPLGASHAHHLGDLAAHIKFADAVRMGLGTYTGVAAFDAAVCCACMHEAARAGGGVPSHISPRTDLAKS